MSVLFGSEPKAELIETVLNEATQLALEYTFEEEGIDKEAIDAQLDILMQLREAYAADKEQVLDRLKNEYMVLFVGPERLPAPPWESVYRSKERLLFNADTLEVRQIYLESGLLSSGYPNEADDHLSTELDFMFRLAEQTREAFLADEGDELASLLDIQRSFLEKHLLVWVGQFTEDIQKATTQMLYPPMARVLCAFLASDLQTLEKIGRR
jgi:TorA maturation chaperone TorD